MQSTTNLKLKKPETTDPVEIQDFNDNADTLDAEITKKMDKTGNASDAVVNFTQATTRVNLTAGEKVAVSFGKIAKWFADLEAVAFSGKASDISEDATHRFATDTEKAAWNAKVTAAGGDIADTKVSAFTASTAAYPVPAAGETTRVGWGKVKKFFEDIRSTVSGACFIGQIVNNCVTNNASLPLSAAQGKALMDLYTQLNSNKADNNKFFSCGPTDTGFFGQWGYIFSNSGNKQGQQYGDCYYLGVDSEGGAQVGVQVNSSTQITWLPLAKTADLFSTARVFTGLDFNNIEVSGIYSDGSVPSISGCKNYPVDMTGILLVFVTPYVLTQMYVTHDVTSLHIRSRFHLYAWSGWRPISFT